MLAKQAAKAEAAKKGEAATKPPASQKPATYTISVKEFLPMAQHITAFHKPPIKVPDSFVKILDRAIALRKKVAVGLGNRSDSASTPINHTSDEGHSFFLGILEGVRDTLKSRMSPDASENIGLSQAAQVGPNPVASLANMFSGLDVEDPVEIVEEQSHTASSAKPAAEPLQEHYKADTVADLEEAVLALICLLTDFASLRTVVTETWMGYKTGLFDIVSASITTNTAMELARRLEEEQEKAFAGHGGPYRVLEMYYIAHCLGEGQNPNSKELPGDDLNFAMYDFAEVILLPTHTVLDAYMRVLEPGSVPLYKPGTYRVYNSAADRSNMSNREKFQEDKIVLCEILPDFNMLGLGTQLAPDFDELTRGLSKAFKTKVIPLSLTFAAQLFLDIHHILRDQVGRGFQDLCSIGHMMQASINQNLEFHKDLRIQNWPASNDLVLRQLLEHIRAACVTDPIQETRSKIAAFRGFEIEQHRLRKSHPLMCGLAVYNIKANFNDAGVAFANAWGSIIFTAHLHNAISAEKILSGRWRDMELLLGIQDQSRMFAGTPPHSPEQYFRRFSLAMGYSATNFARNRRRQNQAAASTAGPRSIQEQAPVSRMFMPRYVHGRETTDMTTQDVENILEKSSWLEVDDHDEGDALVLDRQDKADGKSRLKDSWKAKQRVSIPDLLRTLRISLQAEIFEFSFDYFLMHRQCWRLLRMVKDATQPQMREIFWAGLPRKGEPATIPCGLHFHDDAARPATCQPTRASTPVVQFPHLSSRSFGTSGRRSERADYGWSG